MNSIVIFVAYENSSYMNEGGEYYW